MNAFQPIFTDTGRTAAANDHGNGLQTIITQVVLGDAQYAIRADDGQPLPEALAATALQNELLRLPVYAGGELGPGALLLVAEITRALQGQPTFWIGEIGFLDDEGILVALWSDLSSNLGYRGDLSTWNLSLGLSWIDLPPDQFSVQVTDAITSEQLLTQARLKNQVVGFVTQSGMEYDPDDADQLNKAMDARVQHIVDSLDKAIRTPIAVSPVDGAAGVVLSPRLQGNAFNSADGYTHSASQFQLLDVDGTVVHDSGQLGAVEHYDQPPGIMATLTGYKWHYRYQGTLGETELWTDYSAPAALTTADTYIRTPSILSPADGATEIGPVLEIVLSAFGVENGVDVQSGIRTQIARDAAFTDLLWDSGVVTSTADRLAVPDGKLPEGGIQLYVRGQYVGKTLGGSSLTPSVKITTKSLFAYNHPSVLLTPADGAAGIARRPVLTKSAYVVTPAGHDIPDAAEWRLARDAEMTDVVWTSGVDTANLNSVQVGMDLDLGQQYYWDVRERGTVLGWTERSAVRQMMITEAAQGAVLADGGIVACQHDGYWLVVAPASSRSRYLYAGLRYVYTTLQDVVSVSTPDPQSGYVNTNVLVSDYGEVDDGHGSVGPVAAQFCRSLGPDWFLPSREELQAIQRVASLIDAADDSGGLSFDAMGGDYIWSSTEYGYSDSWVVRSSDGRTLKYDRYSRQIVVPVRRILI